MPGGSALVRSVTQCRRGIKRWRQVLALCLLGGLSACGGGGRQRPATSYTSPDYRAPGPPEDPWGPYINEASGRFDVPSNWIRAVMHQESGGHEYLHNQPITSDAGAAGLMQVMPATYAELADRFHLGPDPYEPHDNILAGTGYIRDLYERYGSPAFLAAYNAGPHRVDEYLAGRGELPNETVNYVASIAPNLSQEKPMTGPLAVYADAGRFPPSQDPVPRAYARAPTAQCWQDPDAAYDPDAPCRSAPPVVVARATPSYDGATAAPSYYGARATPSYDGARAAPSPHAVRAAPPVELAAAAPPSAVRAGANPSCWHDPDAAYDPDAPCRAPPRPALVLPPPHEQAPPVQLAAARAPAGPDWGRLLAVSPSATPRQAVAYAARTAPHYVMPTAASATLRPAMASGRWGIQVGAYTQPSEARRVAESVRSLAPRELGGAQAVLGTTAPFGGHVLYRARLTGLSPQSAAAACRELAAQQQSCRTVAPGA